jgi:phosphatidylglycerophosphatase A
LNSSTIQRALLTAGGLGYLRPAPGTWGSLPPVLLALSLMLLWHPADSLNRPLLINGLLVALAIVFSVVCVLFGGHAEAAFAGKDPSQVVADEVAGQAVALLFLPWRLDSHANAVPWNLAIAVTGFLTFRLMDILKPPPANSLQRLPCGWGILIDDLVAGLYALALTQVITRGALPLAFGP